VILWYIQTGNRHGRVRFDPPLWHPTHGRVTLRIVT
jgi:hypothetical protein